eukprot:TRINITY_DN3921_c0_g1_i3.p1 TRINITY_DN3921_c0_g1~~TRINITY_DN3921_c0_g1_i3.p1  ORF type:complete len:893 (+),score=173.41 TRINITY_DN3921_c0_g1_i3:105-2783(+)
MSQEISINLKTLESQVFHLTVPKDIPITELKTRIERETNLCATTQRLIFQGKVLKDDKNLSFYSVEDGHTLNLVERPPGAPPRNDDPQQPPSFSPQMMGGRIPNLVTGTIRIPNETPQEFNQLLSGVINSLMNAATHPSEINNLPNIQTPPRWVSTLPPPSPRPTPGPNSNSNPNPNPNPNRVSTVQQSRFSHEYLAYMISSFERSVTNCEEIAARVPVNFRENPIEGSTVPSAAENSEEDGQNRITVEQLGSLLGDLNSLIIRFHHSMRVLSGVLQYPQYQSISPPVRPSLSTEAANAFQRLSLVLGSLSTYISSFPELRSVQSTTQTSTPNLNTHLTPLHYNQSPGLPTSETSNSGSRRPVSLTFYPMGLRASNPPSFLPTASNVNRTGTYPTSLNINHPPQAAPGVPPISTGTGTGTIHSSEAFLIPQPTGGSSSTSTPTDPSTTSTTTTSNNPSSSSSDGPFSSINGLPQGQSQNGPPSSSVPGSNIGLPFPINSMVNLSREPFRTVVYYQMDRPPPPPPPSPRSNSSTSSSSHNTTNTTRPGPSINVPMASDPNVGQPRPGQGQGQVLGLSVGSPNLPPFSVPLNQHPIIGTGLAGEGPGGSNSRPVGAILSQLFQSIAPFLGQSPDGVTNSGAGVVQSDFIPVSEFLAAHSSGSQEDEGPLGNLMRVMIQTLTLGDLQQLLVAGTVSDSLSVHRLQPAIYQHLESALNGNMTSASISEYCHRLVASLNITPQPLPQDISNRLREGKTVGDLSQFVIQTLHNHLQQLISLILSGGIHPQPGTRLEPAFLDRVRLWSQPFILEMISGLSDIFQNGIIDTYLYIQHFLQQQLAFVGGDLASMATNMITHYAINTYATLQTGPTHQQSVPLNSKTKQGTKRRRNDDEEEL